MDPCFVRSEAAMSVLFTPGKLGPLEIRNRFVHSATYEAMASAAGEVTDALLARYRKLSHGGVGLIIPGYMFVGRCIAGGLDEAAQGRVLDLRAGAPRLVRPASTRT